MTYQEIIDKVNEFLIEDFEVEAEKILPEAELKETLDLDSLDYTDLIVAIEKDFGFKMKPEDFTDLVTMESFYQFIAEKLNVSLPA